MNLVMRDVFPTETEHTGGYSSAKILNVSRIHNKTEFVKNSILAEWHMKNKIVIKICVMIKQTYGEMDQNYYHLLP